MRIKTVLTVVAAALFALSASAGAAGITIVNDGLGNEDTIYKSGAEYYFYSGPWSESLDLDKLVPDDTKIINIKERNKIEPASSGDSFVKVKGFMKFDQGAKYRFKLGDGNSRFNVMTVRGQEVHRKNIGDTESNITEIFLSEGYHPFETIFFNTVNPFVIWREVGGSGNFYRINAKHLWHEVQFKKEMEPELLSAITALKNHINETSTLNADQINRQTAIIRKNIDLIGQTSNIISEAFDLAACYETTVGPLFMNKATRGGFPRKPAGRLELDRAIFAIQQGLIDYAFTPGNLKKFNEVLSGAAFKTSSYFPGAVDAPVDPTAVHEVSINASQPACWGIPVMDNETSALRPTGCYLAPGSIAKVTVPRSMVGKGFSIRVGAHAWDLKKKPRIKRLDRVSIVYPIEEIHTSVANPLGGGIYIEVPYQANAGMAKVKIMNAVRSPFFSARSFDKTTLEQWKKTERRHLGSWADFESDKFMMQVPTKWIYNYDDPVTLMQDWDKAMDMVSELFGLPLVRSKTVLYLQVDVIFRGSANFPGYPQSNFRYNPLKAENGNSNHWLLKGPQSSGQTIFHELGHAHLFTKFRGEVEAVVNLPYVAALNRGFGIDLDTAFGRSFSNENISLDQAAIMWMVTENFRKGNPMDITWSEANEVRYQHRGYGKYVEIVNLFGWKVLENFWHSVNVDYLKGIEYPRNTDPTDNRILRLSQKAGVDLTPLIHFWGVHPEDRIALKKTMVESGLKPSALIYDRLNYYKTIIPMDNEDFAKHAKTIYPKGIKKGGNPLYGKGYYYTWLPKYDESHGVAVQAALQEIIDIYFPDGRP